MKSNWRLGVENGFDAGPYLDPQEIDSRHRQRHGPAGRIRAARRDRRPRASSTTRTGRRASTTCSANARCRSSRAISTARRSRKGISAPSASPTTISIWLPGVLKVDPWPQQGMTQFEWYIPADEGTHYYLQTLGRRVKDDGRSKPRSSASSTRNGWRWPSTASTTTTCGRARPARNSTSNDMGWITERLYEPDMAIVEWREIRQPAQSRHPAAGARLSLATPQTTGSRIAAALCDASPDPSLCRSPELARRLCNGRIRPSSPNSASPEPKRAALRTLSPRPRRDRRPPDPADPFHDGGRPRLRRTRMRVTAFADRLKALLTWRRSSAPSPPPTS